VLVLVPLGSPCLSRGDGRHWGTSYLPACTGVWVVFCRGLGWRRGPGWRWGLAGILQISILWVPLAPEHQAIRDDTKNHKTLKGKNQKA
jgi:hypothetical protein